MKGKRFEIEYSAGEDLKKYTMKDTAKDNFQDLLPRQRARACIERTVIEENKALCSQSKPSNEFYYKKTDE